VTAALSVGLLLIDGDLLAPHDEFGGKYRTLEKTRKDLSYQSGARQTPWASQCRDGSVTLHLPRWALEEVATMPDPKILSDLACFKTHKWVVAGAHIEQSAMTTSLTQ
jgi:hypothetical protein